MGSTIGDGLVAIGIALMIFAFIAPLALSNAFDAPTSDYSICIKHCPRDGWNYYTDLECPELCGNLIHNYTKVE